MCPGGFVSGRDKLQRKDAKSPDAKSQRGVPKSVSWLEGLVNSGFLARELTNFALTSARPAELVRGIWPVPIESLNLAMARPLLQGASRGGGKQITLRRNCKTANRPDF